jgi:hypothetical protein
MIGNNSQPPNACSVSPPCVHSSLSAVTRAYTKRPWVRQRLPPSYIQIPHACPFLSLLLSRLKVVQVVVVFGLCFIKLTHRVR